MPLRLALSVLLLGCGSKTALQVDSDVAVAGEDGAVDAPPAEIACMQVRGAPIEIAPRADEVHLVASYLGEVGARLVARQGREQVEMLELDFESGTSRVIATHAVAGGTTWESSVSFDATGRRVGLCGEDDASLRVLDDGGGDRSVPFPPPVEHCSTVAFGNDHWLVVAKQWSTERPATLLRAPATLGPFQVTALTAPTRPFVGGGPPLFVEGDGFAFVYRADELDSWPDEALRMQRLDPTFEPVGEPAELLGRESVNGRVWTAAEDGELFLIFRPATSSLPTGVAPHFRAFSSLGVPRGPPVPLVPSGDAGLHPTLHATGAGLYWAWTDTGEGFEYGVAGSGEPYRLVLQPLSHEGEGLGAPILLRTAPGEVAIYPRIQSRRAGDRHELLVAWKSTFEGPASGSVYAALVECLREGG